MLDVIHLQTNDSFKLHGKPNVSQLIIDAFIKSCMALDASIFEPCMKENDVFEDKNKYLFLASMKDLFDYYKEKKTVSLSVNIDDGICKGCKYGRAIKLFSVKGWGRTIFNEQFAYVIEVEKGILKDIFRCNLFT